MSEFAFGGNDVNEFCEALDKLEFEHSEVSGKRDGLEMFMRFLDGDPEFYVMCDTGSESTRTTITSEEANVSVDVSSYEPEVQAYMQAQSDLGEQAGYAPMPHFVLNGKVRPAAEAMVRSVQTDIDRLGGE